MGKFFPFVVVLFLFTQPSDCLSQQPVTCDVEVCLVRAERNPPTDQGAGFVAKNFSGMGRELTELPFREYFSVDTQQTLVTLKKRKRIKLVDSGSLVHVVSVTPTEFEMGKVRAIIDWQVENGPAVVKTRLKMINGEKALLGAGNLHNNSRIIAVTIGCK